MIVVTVDLRDQLVGVGGFATAVLVPTIIRLPCDGRRKAAFNGPFRAMTDSENLDISLLGRDLTNLFALIIDYPGQVVCLLGRRHHYIIHQT